MQSKAARARKDNGEQVGYRTVEIPALQCCVPLHRTLEGDELHLNALLCKVPTLCGNDERNGIRIRHQSDGQLCRFRILRLGI